MSAAFEHAKAAADYIKSHIGFAPEIAVVLGSCLGPFADRIEHPITIDYRDIPHFLVSTAPSHAGKLILGTVAGKKVVCLSGRFHRYEGYSYEQLSIPIRMLHCLGVRATILTNAAGAINLSYQPGDVMVIADHIKLFGDSPLMGPNAEEFGERFPDISAVYTPALRRLALDCAGDARVTVHEGVYFFFPGPQFESPSEIKAARILGGDAAGMSTVPEAITAAHCHMPLLGLSVMVNMAAGVSDAPISGEQIDKVGALIAGDFSDYVETIIGRMEV